MSPMTKHIDLDALQALAEKAVLALREIVKFNTPLPHGLLEQANEAIAAWNRRADTGTTSAQPGQEQPRDENAETETHVVRMAAGDEINLSYERLAEGGNAQILQRRDVAAASDGGSQSAANPVRQLSATPAQEHPQVKRNALSLTPDDGKVRQAEEGK